MRGKESKRARALAPEPFAASSAATAVASHAVVDCPGTEPVPTPSPALTAPASTNAPPSTTAAVVASLPAQQKEQKEPKERKNTETDEIQDRFNVLAMGGCFVVRYSRCFSVSLTLGAGRTRALHARQPPEACRFVVGGDAAVL